MVRSSKGPRTIWLAAYACSVLLLLVLSGGLSVPLEGSTPPLRSTGPFVSGPVPSHPALGIGPIGSPPVPGSAVWFNLTSRGSAFTTRGGAAAAYDPVGNFTLLFGGNPTGGSVPANDTWEYVNRSWVNVTSIAGPAPSQRDLASLAYDALDGFFVLYGGYWQSTPTNAVHLNDTWKFSNGQWSNITTTVGPAPSPRFLPSMAYDPAESAVVLFGGVIGGINNGPFLPMNDTWLFTASHWSNVSKLSGSRSPPGRDEAAVAYDQGDGFLLMYGGYNESTVSVYNDTWRFSGGVWSQIVPPQNPGHSRAELLSAGAESGRYPLLYGGDPATTLAGSNRTWEFKGGRWLNLSGTSGAGPGDRAFGEMVWDPGDRLALIVNSQNYVGGGSIGSTDSWAYVSTPTVTLVANTSSVDLGQSLPLAAVVTGGTPPLHFDWAGLPAGCAGADPAALECVPTQSGNSSIDVWANDSLGFVSTSSTTVQVFPAPLLSVSTSSSLGPPPLSAVLTASTSGGSPPFRIAWVFGDRTTGTGASVHHVFASAGRFDVRAWANDSIGGSVTANLTEIASTPLGVGLTTDSGSDLLDLGQNVTFNATPAGGEAPYQFSWSGLPRGCSPMNLSTLLCHPTQSGVSSVRVNITDSGGASAGSAALTLVVFPALGVNGSATPAMGCGPTSVNFSASGVGGSPPYAFAWTFGAGGDTAIGPSQTREFTTTGWHNATASAMDPEGSHANRTIPLLLVPCSASPPGPGGLTTLELGLVAIAAVVAIALVAVVVIRRRPPTR